MASIPYRSDIDGLRAFAVIPVILFHLGYKWMPGGYTGVDVFFVISGFLITSILLKELNAGTFSFRDFWMRRIRRILPALSLVVICTLAVAKAFSFKPNQPEIGLQAIAGLFSFANIHFWSTVGSYWGSAAEGSPFLHTWSLSVEEQFYLVLPIALWALVRKKPRLLQPLLMASVLISLAAFCYGTQHFPSATFYLLPGRIWELATGCLLATLLRAPTPRIDIAKSKIPFSFVGLCLISIACLSVADFAVAPIIAVAGASMVILDTGDNYKERFLSKKPLVHLGKVSYSLYLWHWPVIVFAREFELGIPRELLVVAIYCLALSTYHLLEQPVRSRRLSIRYVSAFYATAAGFAFALANTSGLYDSGGFATPKWSGLYYDLRPDNRDPVVDLITLGVDAPERTCAADAYACGGIISGNDTRPPEVVVLGDSHGAMWSESIQGITDQLGVKAAFISMNGVWPFVELPLKQSASTEFLTADQKRRYDETRIELIQQWKPALVILSCRWAGKDSISIEFIDFLEQHSDRVILIEQPPELARIGNRSALQYACHIGIKPTAGSRHYLPMTNMERSLRSREHLKKLTKDRAKCMLVPTYDLFCQDGGGLLVDGNELVYLDDDHLTTYGTRLALPRLENAIAQAYRGHVGAPSVRLSQKQPATELE